ncbi:MAG: DNA-3-methyladenine glycosylase I [Nanoarchaeota archaeon]
MKRCEWCESGDLMQEYHDKEWGTPVHDDRLLFEFLILEGAQAGLSWSTVLKKRKEYKKAFDNFDPIKVSKYNEKKVKELLSNSGIIRNKLKIASAITNAKCFLKVKEEFGTFDKYIWQFTNNKTITNHPKSLKEIPAKSPESDAMSKDLLKRGFKFAGSTICYAFMQAVGMVDDHIETCFRKK